MTNEISIPFSTAAQEVFQNMFDLETSTEAQPATNKKDADALHVSIGISGDLFGKIYYSFPKNMTLEIVKIMSGMEFDEVDDFVTSAVSEIVNIISGNALTNLTDQKITCNLTPPQILGVEELPAHDGNQPGSVLKSAIGAMEVSIALTSNE